MVLLKYQIIGIMVLALTLIACGLYIPHRYVVVSRTASVSEGVKLLRSGVVELLKRTEVEDLVDYEPFLLELAGLEATGTSYLVERLEGGGCRVATSPVEPVAVSQPKPETLVGGDSLRVLMARPYIDRIFPCPKSIESIAETESLASESVWTKNYSGTKVLSVAQRLEFLDRRYFLVAEMDRSEVFVPIVFLQRIYWMVYGVFMVYFSMMTYYLIVLSSKLIKARLEREQAYIELKNETEWSKSVLDEMPLGIFTTNPAEVISYVNEEFKRIFSGRDASLDKTPMRKFVGEDEQLIFDAHNTKTKTIEYEGGFYRVRLSKVGNEGWVGVVADITASVLREKHVREVMGMAIGEVRTHENA